MKKRLMIILCIAFQLYSQCKSPKDSSCGKAVFISTVALESVALTGYLATTCLSFGNKKNAADREIPIIASFPFMGTFFLSSGIEKFVTLYQNVKLEKEGKEIYKGKSVLQVVFYTTSLLTGVATVFVTFAETFGGNEPYNATKTLMITNSCLMLNQFIYDIYLYKKNCSLIKKDPTKLSNSPVLKPYLGLSYKSDLKFGIDLYF